MKKPLVVGLVALSVLCFAVAAWGVGETYNGYPVVSLSINGKHVATDVPAIVMDGRTLVPLRFLVEELGYKVNYDSKTATVDIQLGTGPSVPELSSSAFVDTKTVYIKGEPFCEAYKLPPPKGTYVVSEDEMRRFAEEYGLDITQEAKAWTFAGDGANVRQYFYEAKVDGKLYFDYGTLAMLLKYVAGEEDASFVMK